MTPTKQKTSPGRIAGKSLIYDSWWDLKHMLRLFDRKMTPGAILWCIFGSDAFMVLYLFRLRQFAMRWHIPLLNRILRGWQVMRYGIEIHRSTYLGHGVTFLHPVGVTIEGHIGNSSIFMGGNTVGQASRNQAATPIIHEGVTVGCGAKILGGITIGRHAKIGANAVVLTDIAEDAVTIIKPTRSTKLSVGGGL